MINSAHILQLNYEAALLREAELKAKLSRSHVKRDAKGRFVSDKPVGPVTSGAIHRHNNLVATLHHEQPDPREGWSPWLSNEDNVTGECPIPWTVGGSWEGYFPKCGGVYGHGIGARCFQWNSDNIDPITRYRYRLDAMPVDSK